jgi:hypothetical protein
MQADLLILARHYPPEPSGGSRRPYMLARALRDHGVSVIVAAPSALADIALPAPGGGQQASASQPQHSRRPASARWRERLMIPDPDLAWCLRAAGTIRRSGAQTRWLLTTSPPESVHAAGLRLSGFRQAGWIIDMRDLWLERPLLAARRNPARRMVEAELAKLVLARASLVTAPYGSILEEAARLGARERLLLPHAAPPVTDGGEPDPDLVLHTGSFTLSDPGRSIEPVLAAFARAREQRPSLRLELVGRLTDAERARCADRPGLRLLGTVSPDESWAMQARAGCLVVTAAPDAPDPPGKLYEYRATGRPVAAVGDGPWRAALKPEEAGDPVEAMLADAAADAAARPSDDPGWQTGVAALAEQLRLEIGHGKT